MKNYLIETLVRSVLLNATNSTKKLQKKYTPTK